jgi:hypothetical protein
MSITNLYTDGAETNGTHRKFHHDEWRSFRGNKWGKENNKFFGGFGSPQCIPCIKSEEQLSQVTQYKQDPNPRTIRNS